MAKQKTHTDERGTAHTKSYWLPVQLNISPVDSTARIVFYGYKDKAARDDKKAPIGIKHYDIAGPTGFDTYFSPTAMEGAGKGPIKSAYKLAVDTLDTDGKSFFDGATDV